MPFTYLSQCEAINHNITTVIQSTSKDLFPSLEFILNNITMSGVLAEASSLHHTPHQQAAVTPNIRATLLLCRSSQASLLTALPEVVANTGSLVAALDMDAVCGAWGGVLESGLCRHVFRGGYGLWLSLLGVTMGFMLLLGSLCVMHGSSSLHRERYPNRSRERDMARRI